ncbi:MAG: hypothetical protein R3E01_03640 [Pirellulaceae bacterium]
MADPSICRDEPIIAALQKHAVPFVLIGGHAVYRHGYLRSTEDVDAVWRRSEAVESRLLSALIEINAVWISSEIDPTTGIERTHPVSAAYIRAEHLMMLWTDYGPLDLFDYIPGWPQEPVERLFGDSVETEGLRFASLLWLRRMKQAAGRSKDLLDLDELNKRYPETA